MYHMSNADVTGQPQGLFSVSGFPWSLLLHNQDICCVLREQFFSIRTDWFFLLVINFSELEPARISCHTVAIKNLLQNTTNSQSAEAYLDSWLDWLAVFQTFDS